MVASTQNNVTTPQTNTNNTSGNIPPNPKGDMGADTFMKLLVAELKNQDPNQPMDAREMVAQLSSLSSVQKLTEIDDKLSSLQGGSNASTSLQSSGLIGRTVSAKTNRLSLIDGLSQVQGSYQLQGNTKDVQVKVMNADGTVVRTLDAGALKGGAQTFKWDGNMDNGKRAQNGTYTFQVSATDDKGLPVPASSEVSGLVTEVTYESGAPEVVVGGAHVALADVTSIAQ
jgi:flagellar basal-body rod modification protein FlgD